MIDDCNTNYKSAMYHCLYMLGKLNMYSNDGDKYIRCINNYAAKLQYDSNYTLEQFFADIDEIREEINAEKRAVNMVEWL